MPLSDFSLNLINQGVIHALKLGFAPLSSLGAVFSSELKTKEDELTVASYALSGQATREKTKGNAYVIDDNDVDGVKVKLTDQAYVSTRICSEEQILQNRAAGGLNPFVQYGVGKGYELLLDFWTKWWANITIANFGQSVFNDDPATADHSTIVAFRKTFKEAGLLLDPGSVSLVMNTDLEAALLNDQVITNHHTQAVQNLAATQDAVIQRLFEMNLLFPISIPDNGENLLGIAGSRGAVATAMAPVNAAAKYDVYRQITDKQTGLTVTHRQWDNPDIDAVNAVWEILWGFKILDASRLWRIVGSGV